MKPKAEIKCVKHRRAHFPIDELRNNTPNFFGHGKARKLAAQARRIHSDREDEEDDDDEKSSSWIWLAAIGGLGAAGYFWIKNYPDKAREALTSIGAMQIPGVSDLVDTIAGGKEPSQDLTKQVNTGAAAMAPHLASIPKTLSPGVRDLYVETLESDAESGEGEFRFDSKWTPPPKFDGPNPDAAAKDWLGRRYFAIQAWNNGKAQGYDDDRIVQSWKSEMGSGGDVWTQASAHKVAERTINTAVDYHAHRKTGLPFMMSPEAGEPTTEDYALLKSATFAILESERTGKPSRLGDALKSYKDDSEKKGINPIGPIMGLIQNPDKPESQALRNQLRAGFIADFTTGMKAAAGDPQNPAHQLATEFLQMGVPEDPAEIQKWGAQNPEFMEHALASAASTFNKISAESDLRKSFMQENNQSLLRDHYKMLTTGSRPAAETMSALSYWLDLPIELLTPWGAYTPALLPFLPTDLGINRIDKKGAKIVGDDPNVINAHNQLSDLQDALHEVRGLPPQEAKARVDAILSKSMPEGSEAYANLRDHNNFGNLSLNTGIMASAMVSRHGSMLGLPLLGTLIGTFGAVNSRWNNPENKNVSTADWIKNSAKNIGSNVLDMSSHFAAQQAWWKGLSKSTQNAMTAQGTPGAGLFQTIKKVVKAPFQPVNTAQAIARRATGVANAVVNPGATASKIISSSSNRLKDTFKTLTGSTRGGASALTGLSTMSSAAKFGAVLKGVRALSANTAASAIIFEGTTSAIELGKWGYGMLTNSSVYYDDAKIAEVAQNTFANGGRGMGFWGTALSPLQATAVRQGKTEYINQGGDESKMNAVGAGYAKGAQMLVQAKIMKAAVDYANRVVKDYPVFAGLAPDLRLAMSGTIADRAYSVMTRKAEGMNTGVIDIDSLSRKGENPVDFLIAGVLGTAKPRGNATPGVDVSTWAQQQEFGGQTKGLLNTMGAQEVQDVVRTAMAATHERVGQTTRDALETHPLYRHLSPEKKDELAFKAQASWEKKHQSLTGNVAMAKTEDELKAAIAQANAGMTQVSNTLKDFSTDFGFGQKPSKNLADSNPGAIGAHVEGVLQNLMEANDFATLKSPETAKEITERTGFTPERILADSRRKTMRTEDVFKKEWEKRGAIRQKEIVDELKANGLGDLLMEYRGGDRVSDTYTVGGKTYGGAGSPDNSRYGLEGELNPNEASLKNQRIVIEDRLKASRDAAYQRLGVDSKDPNAEIVFQSRISRLPENQAKDILAPFTKANAALHALRRDVRSQGGHMINPQTRTIERFADNTFFNPEATDKLLQDLGETYGFDEVNPPSTKGRYYIDARGEQVDLGEGQEAPKGAKVQEYGVDSSKWGGADIKSAWTINPATGRPVKVSPEAIRRGYKVESPIENPGTFASAISLARLKHPGFFAASDETTHKNLEDFWRQHTSSVSSVPDPYAPAPAYIIGDDGLPVTSIGEGAEARQVTREDTMAHIKANPSRYQGAFNPNLRGNVKPMVDSGDRTKQGWTQEFWNAQAKGDPAEGRKLWSQYNTDLATGGPKTPVAKTPVVPSSTKTPNVKPTPGTPPVKTNPISTKVTPVDPADPLKKLGAAHSIWARGCKIATAGAQPGLPAPGGALGDIPSRITQNATAFMGGGGTTQQPQNPPVRQPPPTDAPAKQTPVPTAPAQPAPQVTPSQPALKSDPFAKKEVAEQKETAEAPKTTTATTPRVTPPTATTPGANKTDPAAAKPSTWDTVKAKAQEGMDWAQKYNLDLAAIPVGLGLMLMGGKAGAIMGALVLGGGAYGAYQRYQALNNAGGEIPPPTDPALLAQIKANPKAMDDYRARVVKERLEDMRVASADEGKWQQWMKSPDNSRFFNSLELAHDFMPSFVKSRVEASDPHFQGINDDQFETMLAYLTGNRIGKPKASSWSPTGLANNANLALRSWGWAGGKRT